MLASEQWMALSPGDVTLLAFWADTASVYALFASSTGQILLTSTASRGWRIPGALPSLSCRYPAGANGPRFVGPSGARWGGSAALAGPWKVERDPSHGCPATAHLAAPPNTPSGQPAISCKFPPAQSTAIPPEPAHIRIHTAGETAASVEVRLGYAHKGSLVLMRGKSPRTRGPVRRPPVRRRHRGA